MQHLQYVGWPDFGAPKTTDSIIALIKTVRNLVAAETATMPVFGQHVKILVHCSAGVGRSGTFIALYQLMELLDEKVTQYKTGKFNKGDKENEIGEMTMDVFNTVFKLRKQRCEMVSI